MKNDLNVSLSPSVVPIQSEAQPTPLQSPVKRFAGPLGRVKCKVTTVAPTATDDASKGFRQFSQWINTTTSDLWGCLDSTVGAAVWKKLSP